MTGLPYHHTWNTRFETSLGLKVKWFGRWGDDPEWVIARSYLASDLICFLSREGRVQGRDQRGQPGHATW